MIVFSKHFFFFFFVTCLEDASVLGKCKGRTGYCALKKKSATKSDVKSRLLKTKSTDRGIN